MEKVQITFFHNEGKYRPIARIVECESLAEYQEKARQYQEKAILSICHTMHITPKEFLKNGYTKVKADTVANIELRRKAKQIERLFNKRNKGE